MMELMLTGKHIEIEPEEREYAEKLAANLGSDFEKLTSLRMVLSEERGRTKCEAILNGKNVNFNASCVGGNAKVVIAGCCDKLGKQMRRYLERIQDRSIQADPALKDKIWKSSDLKLEDDADAEIFE
jgi:ribosomal subunit interface protein